MSEDWAMTARIIEDTNEKLPIMYSMCVHIC